MVRKREALYNDNICKRFYTGKTNRFYTKKTYQTYYMTHSFKAFSAMTMYTQIY